MLVDEGERIFDWGLFAMVPFAGRIAEGRFRFDGEDHRLDRNLPPHAIHGTCLDRRWNVLGRSEPGRTSGIGASVALTAALRPGWPFDGEVTQTLALSEHALDMQIEVTAGTAMPVTVGWHPWFRRRLARGEPVELTMPAAAMYERGPTGVPTGVLLRPPPAGPWDDCFTDLSGPPVLRWPGALALTIESSASHVVVYDEPEHAVCVEPQTGPPDAVNLGEAALLDAGATFRAWCRMHWRPAP